MSLLSAARSLAAGDWPVFGGDAGGSQYSPLVQVNAANVRDLERVWEYRTGDSTLQRPDAVPGSFLATPVLYEGTLYFCSGYSRAFAIDAVTGKERWVFDSKPDMQDGTAKCRGVALWHDDERSTGGAACTSRVFMGTLDGRLAAIDRLTGRACDDFGENGFIDLRQGAGEVRRNELVMTSPPVIYRDLVIQGAKVRDNQRADAAPGVIRAWDARSGELRWAFDPVPAGSPSPQALGAPPGQRYHQGTPNAWSIFSVDEARGLVFIPFGSPGLDFVGGHRNAGGVDRNRYANAVVALRAATGELVWHFQTVHNDLWDYDLASQPLLLDIEQNGESIPALIQATKMGFLFVLNRETGEPIYRVEERAVPQTAIPGETSAATQPFPTFPRPLHPLGLDEDDAWGFTFYDRNACREKIRAARNDGMYTPPALDRYSIQYPGVAGGQNWGGLAYDPQRNLLVMPQNHVVTYNKLVRKESVAFLPEGDYTGGYSPNEGTPFYISHEILLSPFGVPCIAPPWGTLMAVSLDSGEKHWEVPLGTPRDMVPGMSWFPWFPTMGFPSAGGALLTGSGLAFIGAALDNYLRAFDVHSGAELWRARLPAGGQATPMTYRADDGRQYIVIAAGGHAYMRTTPGDSLVAYALPAP